MKYLILLLTFLSFTVNAGEAVTWSWSATTEYTDDSAIADGDLTEYKLYCNSSPAQVIAAPILSYTSTLENGTYSCYVTSVANGVESDPSNIVTKIVQDAIFIPKAPVLSDN